ncbi:MAG TPA: hypothetical protein VGC12_02295 [Methyloradius sp.]
MVKKYAPLLMLLPFLCMPLLAIAGPDIQCPQAKVQTVNGQFLIFGEYEFEHGVHDLAISNTEKSEIKRVTYSGKTSDGQSCVYKSVAFAQGGDWGWHMAWTISDEPGVYYSRMDGEAWVSIPAKRISDQTADTLEFEAKPKHEQVILRGYSKQSSKTESFRLTSEDEGRSW